MVPFLGRLHMNLRSVRDRGFKEEHFGESTDVLNPDTPEQLPTECWPITVPEGDNILNVFSVLWASRLHALWATAAALRDNVYLGAPSSFATNPKYWQGIS